MWKREKDKSLKNTKKQNRHWLLSAVVGVGKTGVWLRVQIFNYKINKIWDANINHVNYG